MSGLRGKAVIRGQNRPSMAPEWWARRAQDFQSRRRYGSITSSTVTSLSYVTVAMAVTHIDSRSVAADVAGVSCRL